MILEILISTMYRKDFSFLEKMFPDNYEKYQILIVNQTDSESILKSDLENIRVINSFDFGLSKSRNLAIQNSIGDICLIADDDIEFLSNFEQIIIDSFNALKQASVILFKIEAFTGESYKPYPQISKQLYRKKDIETASSIEMTFKRRAVLNRFYFNTSFGLGTNFPHGEEYLFLKQVLESNLEIHFQNKVIVKHSLERSTSNIGSDDFVKTQAALYFHDYKNLAYLHLLKFVFFLLRKGVVSKNELLHTFKKGAFAIKQYRSLKS